MNINYVCRTIEMTPNEAKNAGRIGTDQFNELAQLRAAAPGFPVLVVKPRHRRNNSFAHLTVQDMEDYILSLGEGQKENLTVFRKLRGLNADGTNNPAFPRVSHGELKMWFLEQFPEVKETAEIIRNTKKAINAKKETQQTGKPENTEKGE